jgi:hypothetical protein
MTTEVNTEADVGQVDSIVVGEAEDAAREMGLMLSAEAKHNLLRAVQPHLDSAMSRGELETRRAGIVQATRMLMYEVAELHRNSGATTAEVTWGVVDGALEVLCNKFPYLFPICPRH